MGRRNFNSVDEFLFGRNHCRKGNCRNDDSFVSPFGNNNNENSFVSPFGGENNNDQTIVSPTNTVVNPTTNTRTVRRVHPTHVINVNRNVTRVENYYPVTQSVKNINIVKEYNCGSDIRNPRCKPVNNKGCCRNRCCR